MKKFVEEPNLLGLGLSRSVEGITIGLLSSLSIGLLCWGLGLKSFAAGFLYPGYLMLLLMETLDVSLLSSFLGPVILVGASSIPPALIGVLILSKKNIQRISGILLLAVYVTAWTIFSFFFHIMAD
jgi:hypothetical protein